MSYQARHTLRVLFGCFGIVGLLTSITSLISQNSLGETCALLAGTALLAAMAYLSYPPFPTVFYLRRFGDDATGERIRRVIGKCITPYSRLICLHNFETSPDRAPLAKVVQAVAIIAVALTILELRVKAEQTFGEEIGILFNVGTFLLLGLGGLLASKPLGFLNRSGESDIEPDPFSRIKDNYYTKVFGRHDWSIASTSELNGLSNTLSQWKLPRLRWPLRRLFKVRVDESIWPEVVLHIASLADVILIDVSSGGEGLAWEVEEMLSRYGGRVVFFGTHSQAYDPLSILPIKTHGPRNERLARTLKDSGIIWEFQDFLTWRYGSLLRRWRFQRQLRSAILGVAHKAKQSQATSPRTGRMPDS